MKIQKIMDHVKKYIKIYILSIFVIFELTLYFYVQSILNHDAIPANRDGIRFARAEDPVNSEKKFLVASSFNFRVQKINLNRAIMYYNIGQFSISEEILKNLEDSHNFFREASEVHGHNSFAWGKSLLNDTECTYDETLPLWEYARKKFNRAGKLSIFQMDFSSFTRNKKLESEVEMGIAALPEWKDSCMKKGSGGEENSETSRDKSNQEESQSGDNFHPTQNNKDVIQKIKEKRVKLQSTLEFTPDDENVLLKQKEELRSKDSYKEGEYTRFREESMEVRDLDILRQIMEKAKW